MLKRINIFTCLIFISLLYSSCATIVGGSKYYAHIKVNDKPNAQIYYQGKSLGKGSAVISVPRRSANNFSFSVKEENCTEETYFYNSRTFRGWALAGSVFFWTGVISSSQEGTDGRTTSSFVIPVPIGTGVDLLTGALWKPNIRERGVSKMDYKNFSYSVDYNSSCSTNKSTLEKNAPPKTDIIYFKNGNFLRGTIIEKNTGKNVQIRVADGDIKSFDFAEIDRIEQE